MHVRSTPHARALFAIALASAAVFAGAAGAARAADMARLNLIGFSDDGAFVAFEQYGVQDGSGFPYSEIFVIDVAANDWAFGAPARVQLTSDDMTEAQLAADGLAAARRRAMAAAQPALRAGGVRAGNVGRRLIHHPPTDLGVDGGAVAFSLSAAEYAHVDGPHRISLTPMAARSGACDFMDQPPVIFDLELRPAGAAPITLQRDRRLYSSRGCPLSYRIQDVIVYGPTNGMAFGQPGASYSLLVLLNMYAFGFEGQDMRYLGVTARLDGVL